MTEREKNLEAAEWLASDQAVVPGTIWQHKNGGIHCVHVVTNTAVEREGHAPDVVYQCVKTGRWWRRPLSDWHQSFTRRADLDAQPSECADLRAEIASLRAQWSEAYSAFKGAFDTPLACWRDDSEYAHDARQRLREFNEAMIAAPSQQPGEQQ